MTEIWLASRCERSFGFLEDEHIGAFANPGSAKVACQLDYARVRSDELEWKQTAEGLWQATAYCGDAWYNIEKMVVQ